MFQIKIIYKSYKHMDYKFIVILVILVLTIVYFYFEIHNLKEIVYPLNKRFKRLITQQPIAPPRKHVDGESYQYTITTADYPKGSRHSSLENEYIKELQQMEKEEEPSAEEYDNRQGNTGGNTGGVVQENHVEAQENNVIQNTNIAEEEKTSSEHESIKDNDLVSELHKKDKDSDEGDNEDDVQGELKYQRKDIAGLTMVELKKIATKENISFIKSVRKPDLIKSILSIKK